jgi:hypothetical protein
LPEGTGPEAVRGDGTTCGLAVSVPPSQFSNAYHWLEHLRLHVVQVGIFFSGGEPLCFMPPVGPGVPGTGGSAPFFARGLRSGRF